MPATPRDRLVRTAIDLARQRGIEGSGIADILKSSGTARRSLYQHFPGGKAELFQTSTRLAGSWIEKVLRQQDDERPVADLVTELFEQTKRNLIANGYHSGCPIAAAAVAVPEDEKVREAAADAFAGWTTELARRLRAQGRTATEARSLASFVVSGIEGALLQARAARSSKPLDDAQRHLVALIGPERR